MAEADSTPSRLAVLQQIAAETHDALQRIDRRLDTIQQDIKPLLASTHSHDAAITELARQFDRLERRYETLEKRQHTDFLTMLTIMLGGYAGLFGVMAHGFKWI